MGTATPARVMLGLLSVPIFRALLPPHALDSEPGKSSYVWKNGSVGYFNENFENGRGKYIHIFLTIINPMMVIECYAPQRKLKVLDVLLPTAGGMIINYVACNLTFLSGGNYTITTFHESSSDLCTYNSEKWT